MKLNFDLANVTVTEFGVGLDVNDEQTFVGVPVDASVQTALREMAQATWDTMQKDEDGPVKYEPSDKHAATEYLYVSLTDELASSMRVLYRAKNLDVDARAMSNPAEIFCYFAKLIDKTGRRLIALRRATQFKGVLKSKNRLVAMLDDTLQIVDATVFKLDTEFDLLVDSAHVHILRPSGFEFTGRLQQAILDAVPENLKAIRKNLAFVKFDGIAEYAAKHPRAARYLASIRGGAEIRNIDKSALKRLCRETNVEITESKGMISISVGSELGFLEVLDRRRYEVELVKGQPERFRAASRRRLNG